MSEVAIDLIDPPADNLRQDLGDLEDLAASIRAQGVLQPVLVTPRDERYLLVAGSRRLAAARSIGLHVVPAVVRRMSERERVAAMLVENLQRNDLTPIEEAFGYARLAEVDTRLRQRGLARLVGKSQSHISKRLALLELPPAVQAHLHAGRLSPGAGWELHRLVAAGCHGRAEALADLAAQGKLKPSWKPLRAFVNDELRAAGLFTRRAAERKARIQQGEPVGELPSEVADRLADTGLAAELQAKGLKPCPTCGGKGAVPLREPAWTDDPAGAP